jgi:plasmid stabilization system protein ParE
MQTKEWQEKGLNDIDDYFDYQQINNKQQAKRKWREIEALKEHKRMQREIASYDSYAMH